MFGTLIPSTGGDDITLSKNELIVGRSSGCDITMRFPDVSGRHCKLVLSNGYWYVLDLRSTNGTRVNGMRTTDMRIDPGRKIRFAAHEYSLEYDPLANGSNGAIPPDSYETDANLFNRSLLAKAGLTAKDAAPKRQDDFKPMQTVAFTQEELEHGVRQKDYTDITLDDLTFDR